jgi:hypothetical protein
MAKIIPDHQDLAAVARERGEPRSTEEEAEHYRLAQARKLIRSLAVTQAVTPNLL